MRPLRRWILALLGALLLWGGPAAADGIHIPERAYAVPPAIPTQRALIVYRGGVEELTVESALDAEGQSFGWILPVPAVPTAIEETTAGGLDTLDLATAPEVVHDRIPPVAGREWLLLLLFLGFLFGSRVALVRKGFHKEGLKYVFVLAFYVFLCPAAFLPNLLAAARGARSAEAGETLPSAFTRIGNYNVKVLEAAGAGALDAWLEGNGLAPLPAEGRGIVDAYVSEGWRFLVLRLVREGGGLSIPHPLRVVFPVDGPIYPMRLTALAGGATAVRLHVVATGRASAAGLEARFCDAYGGPLGTEDGNTGARFLECTGRRFRRRLAHDAVTGSMWEGCVLTRLEGTLSRADMERDVAFSLGDARPLLPTVYSEEGALETGWIQAGTAWFFVVLVLLFVSPGALRTVFRVRHPFLAATLAVTLAAAGGAAAIRAILPVVPVRIVSRMPGTDLGPFAARRLGPKYDMRGKSSEDVRRDLDAEGALAGSENPFTGAPLRWGDSPGDLELIEDRRGLVLRYRSRTGRPEDTVLRSPPPK